MSDDLRTSDSYHFDIGEQVEYDSFGYGRIAAEVLEIHPDSVVLLPEKQGETDPIRVNIRDIDDIHTTDTD